MRSSRKSAITHLQSEMPQWIAIAERELADPATREIGTVRKLLIAESQKLLALMKRHQQSAEDTEEFQPRA